MSTSGRSTSTPRPARSSRQTTSSTRTRSTGSRLRSPGRRESRRWRSGRRPRPSPTARRTTSSGCRSRAPRTGAGRSSRTRPIRTPHRSGGTTRTAPPEQSSPAPAETTSTRTPTVTTTTFRIRGPIRTVAPASTSTSHSTSTDVPLDYRDAAVTNLFYWNNIVHDVLYQHGFDEAAGNFQVSNYGNGGLGNDDVRAEAQDGSGRNNANFGTPVDGQRPRMQMFEWRSSAPNPIVVHAPSPIAGTYFGPMAGFGDSLATTGPISGEVVYVGRGCDPAYQAGQPLDPYLVPAGGKDRADRPRQLHLRRQGEEGAGPGRGDGDRRQQRPRARDRDGRRGPDDHDPVRHGHPGRREPVPRRTSRSTRRSRTARAAPPSATPTSTRA